MRHALLALGLTFAGCAGVDETLEGRWSVVQTDDLTPMTRDGAVLIIHGDGTFYAGSAYASTDGCLVRLTTTGTWSIYPNDHEISFRGLEATAQGCEPAPHAVEPFAELVYTYELGFDLTLRGRYTTTLFQRR